MSNVRQLIGPDEKLVGIAHLHWIYIAQGVLWFVVCVGIARLTGGLFNQILATIPATSAIGLPIVALQAWLTPFALLLGAILCGLYVAKTLTTEIGLTSRRLIYKRGWLFVNIQEIEIEEIRGENLDMGYLGRILNYAYIHIDCRFIGDVHLPAIGNPSGFLKALHKCRTKITDTVSLVVGDKTIAMVEDAAKNPPALTQHTPALQDDKNLDQSEVIAKAVAQALQTAPSAPAQVDPITVAAIVEQVVPTMVERVAEKVTEKVTEKVQEELETKRHDQQVQEQQVATAPLMPIPADMEIPPDAPTPAPNPLADESRLEPEGNDEELLQEFIDAAGTPPANENQQTVPVPQKIIH
ncbi:MAG TPA: PH domain-containing protein [Micavibrio sp.]